MKRFCEHCDEVIHLPDSDRTLLVGGWFDRLYHAGWRQVEGKWCCTDCVEEFVKKEDEMDRKTIAAGGFCDRCHAHCAPGDLSKSSTGSAALCNNCWNKEFPDNSMKSEEMAERPVKGKLVTAVSPEICGDCNKLVAKGAWTWEMPGGKSICSECRRTRFPKCRECMVRKTCPERSHEDTPPTRCPGYVAQSVNMTRCDCGTEHSIPLREDSNEAWQAAGWRCVGDHWVCGKCATKDKPDLVVYDEADEISAVLAEREKRYGDFEGHAAITQDLKAIMEHTDNWSKLSPDQREALEMIVHKIGRILNGDPDYDDSWIDIAGYAKLVADRLKK